MTRLYSTLNDKTIKQMGRRLINNKRACLLLTCTFSIFYLIICFKHVFGESKGKHLFISSTYYVKEGDQSIIRILTTGKSNIKNPDLFCEIDGRIVKASLSKMSKNTDGRCKWSNYFLDCKIDNADEKPKQISLMDGQEKKHELQLTKTSEKSHNLVVCFSPLYMFENWPLFLASLEMYNFYGADLSVVPIFSVIEQIHTILMSYAKEGRVKLKRAIKLPQFTSLKYDPNTQINSLNQELSFTECLYDYKDSADFILNIDLEDLLVPKKFNSLTSELHHLVKQYPNAASFEFLQANAVTHAAQTPQDYTVRQFMGDTFISEVLPQGKRVFRPKFMTFIKNSNNKKQQKYGKKRSVSSNDEHVILGPNDTLVVHYEKIVDKSKGIPVTNLYSAYKSYYLTLDGKFHKFLDRNLDAKQAFKQLPQNLQYTKLLSNCSSTFSLKEHKNLMYECSTPLNCNWDTSKLKSNELSACVHLFSEYKETTFEGDFKVSSVVTGDFLPVNDCFA